MFDIVLAVVVFIVALAIHIKYGIDLDEYPLKQRLIHYVTIGVCVAVIAPLLPNACSIVKR